MLNLYKLIAFDLDGTLTEHRTPIDENNYKLLEEIQKTYATVIVGAGTCERIAKQLREFPIDIIGNYGMQKSFWTDNERMIEKAEISVDKEEVTRKVDTIRELTGYISYKGHTVEFHESGVITFPLLGTDADIQHKLEFDPTREKRRAIFGLVKDYFNDYTVFIGGSSSFDIVPKQYNKYIALCEYARTKSIEINEILYVGDDFSEGGNDEQIFISDIECVEVDSYKTLRDKLDFLLK